MGSYSASNSYSSTSATDKRQVVSEAGIGQTIDGNSNYTNVQNLDGGAIGAAFDFANKSLSSMIALAVERDKVTTAAQSAVQDSAIKSIAEIGKTSAQSAAAAAISNTAAAADKAAAGTLDYKKYALWGGGLLLAWWFFKGHK